MGAQRAAVLVLRSVAGVARRAVTLLRRDQGQVDRSTRRRQPNLPLRKGQPVIQPVRKLVTYSVSFITSICQVLAKPD